MNKSDISLKRLAKNETSWQRDTPNYEYLIVTCDSLKPEFQRLADWKTMKGVRAKVITIEEIYNSQQGTTLTHQQQIKQTLLDYYEVSNHKLQYVLLGGDNSIVPSELCYVKCSSLTRETATDLYYASLKSVNWDINNNGLSGEVSDSVDFSPDIIVTRLSVQNTDDARLQVNRILHYEQNPDIMDWSNRILLCGACLKQRYHYPVGYITDTHFKAEQYLYNNCILPYWQNGVRYKLYDTGSSFEGDALYDFNVNNLQDQFRRGYTFVNVDTHGEFDNWKMEYKPNLITFYENPDAENMENIKANTIITTTACLTNDYTESQPCLSECFMRNPNSGIIGYYGCSKEGWYTPDSITEGSSLKYDRKMYECLFTSNHHQLGRAIYDSKMSFGAQCSYYGSMRWLMFGLNALCDPEMPVFLSQPQSFTNVQISRSSNSLTVNTGGVSDCRICVMSRDDNGYSYYAVEDSVGSQSFLIGSDTYNVCISKAGYIPYIAVVGSNVYLQNEDIEYDLYIFANQTFIGNNVILNQPTGIVNILRGKTTVLNTGTVTIPSGFKVEKGASFIITH